MPKFSLISHTNQPSVPTKFTTQQVCKVGKREGMTFTTQNPILSMHENVHLTTTYVLRVHQFTAQQIGKEWKGTIFQLTQSHLGYEHVYLMATYRLRVHQFPTQQVGKGGKRRNKFSLVTKKMSKHKHVHWMATYILRVHQFTTQQVGKGGKRRNKFSLNTKSLSRHKRVHSKATYTLRVHNTASG